MSKNIFKKIVLLAVTSIGLYFSGHGLITMLSRLATIKSFSEALTVMTFYLEELLETLIFLLKVTSQMILTEIY
jgi:hypothetical protein